MAILQWNSGLGMAEYVIRQRFMSCENDGYQRDACLCGEHGYA